MISLFLAPNLWDDQWSMMSCVSLKEWISGESSVAKRAPAWLIWKLKRRLRVCSIYVAFWRAANTVYHNTNASVGWHFGRSEVFHITTFSSAKRTFNVCVAIIINTIHLGFLWPDCLFTSNSIVSYSINSIFPL